MMIITINVWMPLRPFYRYSLADTIDTSPPLLCMFTTFKPSVEKMKV